VYSYPRGWEIAWNEKKEKWFYVDNGKPFDDNRVCKRCGEPATKKGYDACLGVIPGVINACCGHGKVKPFIVYKKGI